jgi:hypothetical protein
MAVTKVEKRIHPLKIQMMMRGERTFWKEIGKVKTITL